MDGKLEDLVRRVADVEDAVRRELEGVMQNLGSRVTSEANNSASALEDSQRTFRQQLEDAQRRAQEIAEQAQLQVGENFKSRWNVWRYLPAPLDSASLLALDEGGAIAAIDVAGARSATPGGETGCGGRQLAAAARGHGG